MASCKNVIEVEHQRSMRGYEAKNLIANSPMFVCDAHMASGYVLTNGHIKHSGAVAQGAHLSKHNGSGILQ